VREGFKVKQIMLLHVGIASDDTQVEKLKRIATEFIAQEQLLREKKSSQLSVLDELSTEERVEMIKQNMTHKKRGRKPTVKLENVTADDKISLADLTEEKRIVEGFHDVAGHVYDQINYQTLLSRKKDNEILYSFEYEYSKTFIQKEKSFLQFILSSSNFLDLDYETLQNAELTLVYSDKERSAMFKSYRLFTLDNKVRHVLHFLL
jgi:hypothetical protein